MYAMVLGRLPFCTPFKDEYHRQRMLQQIHKGLSVTHDREMQPLSAGQLSHIFTGWSKKVRRYRESSLNRVKTVSGAKFFINFEYKISTRILYVCIKHSTRDIICDVITCCVWVSMYMIEKPEKKTKKKY